MRLSGPDGLRVLNNLSDDLDHQLEFLDLFVKANECQIVSALQIGLESQFGAQVALKILALQAEKQQALHRQIRGEIALNNTLTEGQIMLATVGQVFHELKAWFNTSGVVSLDVDSLIDLEEYVMARLIHLNSVST